MVRVTNNSLQNLQQSRMCPISSWDMEETCESPSLKKLLTLCARQNDYFHRQCLTNLNEDELNMHRRMRNACVLYIRSCRVYFETTPDVFAMAVGILDVFSWKVKVTEKFMTIVASACYLLACKVKEEEEKCPTPRELASLPFNSWTANDLCRMEVHILRKLNYDLNTVNYLDFLPPLANLYQVDANVVRGDRLIVLAEHCLTKQSTVFFKPLIVALSLFSHTTGLLKELGSHLSKADFSQFQLNDSALGQCMTFMSDQSCSIQSLPHTSVPRRSVSFPVKMFDKPSSIGSTCLPTISEE